MFSSSRYYSIPCISLILLPYEIPIPFVIFGCEADEPGGEGRDAEVVQC